MSRPLASRASSIAVFFISQASNMCSYRASGVPLVTAQYTPHARATPPTTAAAMTGARPRTAAMSVTMNAAP
jgi:hypothetical protein